LGDSTITGGVPTTTPAVIVRVCVPGAKAGKLTSQAYGEVVPEQTTPVNEVPVVAASG
jgi:hypothetical protein